MTIQKDLIDCPECSGKGFSDLSDNGTSLHPCLLCKGAKQIDKIYAYRETDIHENIVIDGREVRFTCLHRGHFKQGNLLYFIRKACFIIDFEFVTVYGHVIGTMLDLGTGDKGNGFGYYARLYGDNTDHNSYNSIKENARILLEETAQKIWDSNYEKCR